MMEFIGKIFSKPKKKKQPKRRRTFYFTNQTVDRHYAREIELKIEKSTHITLNNPFYDGDAKEVKQLDHTGKSDLSHDEIVGADLRKVREADGIVWLLSRPDAIHIGSSMEAAIASFSWGKPVYLISEHKFVREHPWVKYFGIRTFSSVYEFINFANEEL